MEWTSKPCLFISLDKEQGEEWHSFLHSQNTLIPATSQALCYGKAHVHNIPAWSSPEWAWSLLWTIWSTKELGEEEFYARNWVVNQVREILDEALTLRKKEKKEQSAQLEGRALNVWTTLWYSYPPQNTDQWAGYMFRFSKMIKESKYALVWDYQRLGLILL